MKKRNIILLIIFIWIAYLLIFHYLVTVTIWWNNYLSFDIKSVGGEIILSNICTFATYMILDMIGLFDKKNKKTKNDKGYIEELVEYTESLEEFVRLFGEIVDIYGEIADEYKKRKT